MQVHSWRFVVPILIASISFQALALPRDDVEKRAFRKRNPCPSTGKTSGACPGYQVDHKEALMNRGADKPANMQWLSTAAHKAKTKADIAECKDSYRCKNAQLKKRVSEFRD